MRVRCEYLQDGPGPSDAVVRIRTSDGSHEEVVLSRKSIHARMIGVGAPLIEQAERLLIELRREAISGRWRICLPASAIEPDTVMQAAE